MKNKIIVSAMLTASLTLSAVAQTTGGAGAAVSGNTSVSVNTPAGTTANSANNATVNAQGNFGTGTLPSGLERRDQLPPGLQNQESLPPGLAKRFPQNTNGNGVTATNQFVFNTNQVGTGISNQFGFITNQFSGSNGGFRAMNTGSNNLIPTGRSNWMNQYTASNQLSLTTDQAVTVNDRTLLVQIQQSLQATITANGTALPVHFRVDNGVVTVVGTVPTAADAQQIYSVVQRTPGVTRVVNGLQVGDGTGAVQMNGQSSVTTTETVRPGPSSSYSGSGTYYYDNNPANFGSNMPPTSVPNTPARIYVAPSVATTNTVIVP
jgi:hypothetical protein